MSHSLLLSALVLKLHEVYFERKKAKRLAEGRDKEATLRRLEKKVADLCRPYWGDLQPHPKEGKVHFILGHNVHNAPCMEGERFMEVNELLNIPQTICFLKAIEDLRPKNLWSRDECTLAGLKEWQLINGKEEPCYIHTAFTLSGKRHMFECWHTIPRCDLSSTNGGTGSWWWVYCQEPSIVQLFIEALVPKTHQMFKNEEGATYWLP